jgi:hypothetical protein
MPDGLVDPLTRAELVDLVRFLSELGKAGPYAASKARLARTWQVLEATPEARAILESTPEGAVSADPVLRWRPAYSQVSGLLPLEDLPAIAVGKEPGKDTGSVTVVRCRLDVTTPGPVRLRLNSSEGVSLFQNQHLRNPGPSLEWELPAGVHTVTLAIDRSRRRTGVRIELEEVPGSPARVSWVVGK